MGRYAKVVNGVVVNILISDAITAAARGLIETDTANKGWMYDDTTFTEPTRLPNPPLSPEQIAQADMRAKPDGTIVTAKNLRDMGWL